MDQLPSEDSRPRSRSGALAIAAAVVAAVTVAAFLLLPGLLAGEGTSRGLQAPGQVPASSPADPAGTQEPTDAGMLPPPDLADSSEGVAVNRWHLRAQSSISAIVGFFEVKWGKKSATDQLQACSDLGSMVTITRELPKAPASAVDAAFTAWVSSLQDVVDFCQAPRSGVSPEQWEQSLDSRIAVSAARFAGFVSEVSRYVDLREPRPNDAGMTLE